MRQKQTKKNEPDLVDFGLWVKGKLVTANVTIADLARASSITYPSLSNMLNSGNRGKPTRQDADTVTTIARALRSLEVIADEREAFVAAGFLARGYLVVREEDLVSASSERETEDDEFIRFYKGLPPDRQRMSERAIRALFDEQDEEDNEGTIGGKRAE